MGEFVGKELQGNVATELQVFRLIDHAHAPAPDLAEDAVMGNRLPHGLGGRGHWVDMLGGGEGGGQRSVKVRFSCLARWGWRSAPEKESGSKPALI